MFKCRAEILRGADGLVSIEISSWLVRLWLGCLLTYKYGFGRSGNSAIGPYEALYPSFVKGGIEIMSGRDDSEFFLLAKNPESAVFLQSFFEQHCK